MTIFLGSRAYAKWAAFWPARKDDPSSDEWDREFSKSVDRAEKVVFSRTLRAADSDPNDVVPVGAPGRHDFRLLESRPSGTGRCSCTTPGQTPRAAGAPGPSERALPP